MKKQRMSHSVSHPYAEQRMSHSAGHPYAEQRMSHSAGHPYVKQRMSRPSGGPYVQYGSLAVSFVKRHYYPHLLLTLLFVAFSGGFVSFKGLGDPQAAKVMEMYAAFVGILLFTPLFMPEQDKEIQELERSKATPVWKLYLPRIFLALLVCLLVISMFVGFMERGGGDFNAGLLFRGACCEILFLGSIGFFASAVTNQVVIGYMAAVVYFAMNVGGGKYLGKFALFQMMQGEYGAWMYWLSGAAALFIAGVLIRERRR